MRLSDLIDAGPDAAPPPDIDIAGLTADSRAVRPGYLFAALPGGRADGADFIDEAVRRGAAAVLARPGATAPVPVVSDANPRRRLALMAARFFGAQPRTIAAVTGTNGKTSVAVFTRQIWSALGHRAASLGTLGVTAPGREEVAALTTPDPVALHGILAQLAADGVDHLALEASSIGLDQYRLDGVNIRAAAFTNLSRDHLDYHGTEDAYLAAKLRLFEVVMGDGGTAVLNIDVAEYPALAAACRARGHAVITYGHGDADIAIRKTDAHEGGQRLTLEVGGRSYETSISLVGAFQASNIAAALGLVLAAGGEAAQAIAALSDLAAAPGRMQAVGRHPEGAVIFVDYAHTPDALAAALETLRPHAKGRLVVVFGCGGDRDPGKRPLMGAVARRLADHVVVSDDNPRGEEAAAIRAQILAACPDAIDIGDRATAIRRTIAGLGGGDVLLIAGKGHERGQIVGDRVLPFDDAEVARRALREIEGGGQ